MKKDQNKNSCKSNYWKGIPDELHFMCLEEMKSSRHSYSKRVLNYLKEHMNDCESFIFGTTPYDVIHWIDVALEICLFPLEQREDIWINNTDDICQILIRSEELLKRVAPADYKEGYRVPGDSLYEFNTIEYSQKLDVYFSVLYMFSEEWDKLRERLEQLRIDTEQNVIHMVSFEDAEKYASWDDWAEYHYAGTDSWEPLNWIYREFIPGGNATKIYTEVFKKYVLFLNREYENPKKAGAFLHLKTNAEKRLDNLNDLIQDEIEG